MSKEEIMENISDPDLLLAIQEMKKFEDGEIKFDDTMMLREIYYSLDEIEAFNKDIDNLQLSLWVLKEYGFRKAGLK